MDNKTSIKNRRLELNLTLEEVAKMVGVTKATVQRWESGLIANMKRDKIALLAKALRTTPSFILGLTDNSTNYGVNNGIIGNNNQNNNVSMGKPLTPIQNAIVTVCTALDERQQGEVLTFATSLLNKTNKPT